jgi:hypothetical protein
MLKKCWRHSWKMLTKKCSQHFQKMLTKKYLQQFKSNKKVKARGYLGDLNILSGLFWVLLGFIVHILIHLPVVTYIGGPIKMLQNTCGLWAWYVVTFVDLDLTLTTWAGPCGMCTCRPIKQRSTWGVLTRVLPTVYHLPPLK